jgi:hypothetical protein
VVSCNSASIAEVLISDVGLAGSVKHLCRHLQTVWMFV